MNVSIRGLLALSALALPCCARVGDWLSWRPYFHIYPVTGIASAYAVDHGCSMAGMSRDALELAFGGQLRDVGGDTATRMATRGRMTQLERYRALGSPISDEQLYLLAHLCPAIGVDSDWVRAALGAPTAQRAAAGARPASAVWEYRSGEGGLTMSVQMVAGRVAGWGIKMRRP